MDRAQRIAITAGLLISLLICWIFAFIINQMKIEADWVRACHKMVCDVGEYTMLIDDQCMCVGKPAKHQ